MVCSPYEVHPRNRVSSRNRVSLYLTHLKSALWFVLSYLNHSRYDYELQLNGEDRLYGLLTIAGTVEPHPQPLPATGRGDYYSPQRGGETITGVVISSWLKFTSCTSCNKPEAEPPKPCSQAEFGNENTEAPPPIENGARSQLKRKAFLLGIVLLVSLVSLVPYITNG